MSSRVLLAYQETNSFTKSNSARKIQTSLNQALEEYQKGKTRRRRVKPLLLQRNLEKTETTVKAEEPNK